MKILPLNNNVLIEVVKEEETKSGIIIPPEHETRLEKGKVIALDENIVRVKKGDSVFFKLYSLSSVEIDGKEFHFIKEEDILGVEN